MIYNPGRALALLRSASGISDADFRDGLALASTWQRASLASGPRFDRTRIMNEPISPNTRAILLLTAPLIIGRDKTAAKLLTPGQYKRLAQGLREQGRQPSDLLGPNAEALCEAMAKAERTLVSGAARGIDQAAMRGALEAQGRAIGVLADSLERAALQREHRNLILDERLVLISPYDPAAGFNVGNAMQRNKSIYALADAALVVSSHYKKGGTWAGAIEHLQKHRSIPVYVRAEGEASQGLTALRQAGASPWPEPETAEDLTAVLSSPPPQDQRLQESSAPEPCAQTAPAQKAGRTVGVDSRERPEASERLQSPADELFATVRAVIARSDTPKTDSEIAEELKVSKTQAKEWLRRLVEEGVLEKTSRPVRYRRTTERPQQKILFG